MPATKQAREDKSLKIHLPQLERVDARLDMFLEEDQRQFIIVRAHRYGVPIYEYCGGVSTNDYGIKQDTISCVFSITKPVVAALTMKLLEDGLWDIYEPVGNYIDSFKGEGRDGICIWHLLTHTSGITDDGFAQHQLDFIEKEYGLTLPENASVEECRALEEQVREKMGIDKDTGYFGSCEVFLRSFKPEKEPGQLMSYNSLGYAYLGKLISRLSGMSIEDYGREALFDPLGMKDTHFILPKEKWPRVAGRNDKCTDYDYMNSERCFNNDNGGGGMKSTVIDMCRFGDMLLGGGTIDGARVLSPASVREMGIDHNYRLTATNPWDSWGLGFNVRSAKKDDAGVLRSAHSLEHGGWGGHKFMADPERGVTITMFTGEYRGDVFTGDHPKPRNIFYIPNNMIIAALNQ